MAPGASDVLRRVAQARVALEAPPRPQAEEDLAWAPLQCSVHLDAVLARLEDEQGDSISFFEPT